ncbi:protein maelstrom homolog isoform X2 [Spodoptera litura]|uniref:Protein maelstrom homolog isoform X2 n=1 Tax=Spodoptera litura TaxID=69820 RepID=A0A9J7EDU8_SPOLT|nr:protein maelstrom homolog isoform X2 [Spodoptera litura]
MPKKLPNSGFYYFMLDFKEQQRLKGIHYQALSEVVPVADPEWRSLPPSARAKYEEIAMKAKEKRNMPTTKYASTGVPLQMIAQQEEEKQSAIDTEIQDIRNLVKTKTLSNEILDEYFYLIDVNYYCKWDDGMHLIGESTVLRFNLRNGIKDYYPELINPGMIPTGYASDVKEGCIELGLDMPDEESPSNMMDILANIIDFLRQKDVNSKALPPLFTMPEKLIPCKSFLNQMCRTASEDELLFRLYRLDTLFFYLINGIKTQRNEGFPHESLALAVLRKDNFRYSQGLACKHHTERGKPIECTDSRTFRWAYTVLDSCCPVAGIQVRPGNHVPSDINVEKFKDDRATRTKARIAGYEAASSSCNTTANDSILDDTASTSGSVVSAPSRAWAQPSSSQASSAWPQLAGNQPSSDWPQLSPSQSSSAWPQLPGSSTGSGSQMARAWPQPFLSQSSRPRGKPSGSGATERQSESGRRERRTHEPLRMPQADYSQNIQGTNEWMEKHSPLLETAGHGRGRGLASSMNKMNINKKK